VTMMTENDVLAKSNIIQTKTWKGRDHRRRARDETVSVLPKRLIHQTAA